MRTLVTAQHAAFFAQNGYIEFEEVAFDSHQIFTSIRSLLEKRTGSALSRMPPSQLYALGRDLWRDDKTLQKLLLKALAQIALNLIGKPLRLACDQWIPSGNPWEQAAPFKGLFSIQGMALGIVLCSEEVSLPLRAPLGLLPLPKNPSNVLFIKPELLIDWPSLAKSPAVDLYFGAYAQNSAVYIHNPKDPSGNALKQMGYHFGDTLQNHSHPILFDP